MGIKTVPHPSYSPDPAPCDFWLFAKFRSCCYETPKEMKKAVTKVIDTLKQEVLHGAFQKLLERYIYMHKKRLGITWNEWYAMEPNQTKS